MNHKLTLLALMALVITAFTPTTASAHENCYRHYSHCGYFSRGCYVKHYTYCRPRCYTREYTVCAPSVEVVTTPVTTVCDTGVVVGGCHHWGYRNWSYRCYGHHFCHYGHFHFHHRC